jgi:hypothetical protein
MIDVASRTLRITHCSLDDISGDNTEFDISVVHRGSMLEPPPTVLRMADCTGVESRGIHRETSGIDAWKCAITKQAYLIQVDLSHL